MNRRRFLSLLPTPLAALIVVACGGDDEPEPAQQPSGASGAPSTSATPSPTSGQAGAGSGSQAQLSPTPACGDDDDPTPAQTEGPYFTPNSPERVSLVEAGMGGTKLAVEGFVLSTSCQPVVRALVDFWQCDDAGAYDNSGFRLRGHQFTDAAGKYRLETIVPGLYPGRTRHIHVKVQAPNRPVLTTQLYFPTDAASNQRDGIYSAALELEDYKDASGGKAGTFSFVLSV
ncbi:MAG: intradiol ring-cleavage dioxygenase [Dehalococcoidia bacterium]|nr:intradiol ring-cleavage dioxygenase [Dehalococcoidia bacterium]